MGCKDVEFNINAEFGVKKGIIGFAYRIFAASIFAALVIAVICLDQHNDVEVGVSNVYTNLEGVDINVKTAELFDAIDLTGPNKESGSFFITTNKLTTDQEFGICTDSEDGGRPCKNNNDCKNVTKTKNGLTVEDCDSSKKVCKIKGWCPVEDAKSATTTNPKLEDISGITVYVKNRIAFLDLKKYEQNYNFKNVSKRGCRYDKDRSPLCPIFEMSTLLKKMRVNYSDIREQGATFGFSIKWDCYYNLGSDPCSIKYELKNLVTEKAPGCDRCIYKYAKFDKANNKRGRTKISALGLRFVVLVESRGYRFSILKFIKYVGALFIIIDFCMFLACWVIIKWFLKEELAKLKERLRMEPGSLLIKDDHKTGLMY